MFYIEITKEKAYVGCIYPTIYDDRRDNKSRN